MMVNVWESEVAALIATVVEGVEESERGNTVNIEYCSRLWK